MTPRLQNLETERAFVQAPTRAIESGIIEWRGVIDKVPSATDSLTCAYEHTEAVFGAECNDFYRIVVLWRRVSSGRQVWMDV